jgi:hypothetical protein
MLAVAISDRAAYAGLALFPALAFWGLDAYYLRQERLFREVYRAVGSQVQPPASSYSYSLDTGHSNQDRVSGILSTVGDDLLSLHRIPDAILWVSHLRDVARRGVHQTRL